MYLYGCWKSGEVVKSWPGRGRRATSNTFLRFQHWLRAFQAFKALLEEFVSLIEQVDTSTPTGKMVFTVRGVVAELERSLIAERVRAGLRNARAKRKRLGRPRKRWIAPK